MATIEIKQISSLEKVFLNNKENFEEHKKGSMLKGEEYSYQIMFSENFKDELKGEAKVRVESEIADFVTVRLVKNIPSELSAYAWNEDGGYITMEPGLFPDALINIEDNTVAVIPNLWQALWVSINIPKDFKAGEYEIKIFIGDKESVFTIDVIDDVLPEQELVFTQWFHNDCIADVHGVEINSPKHWELIEKYIKTASFNGINMLLTPVFTIPLDTQVGGERPTFQLVEVKYDGKYEFNFEKLEKWIDICQKNGIKYFEISHLFTQWGAKHTPKIEVEINGKKVKKFGWHTNSDDKEYIEFLDNFLPQLTAFLKEKGVLKNTYFHISDEPSEEHLESYTKAKNIVKKHLDGLKMIDALSDIKFYKNGLVEIPIPSSNHIEHFLEEDVPERWVYYCCAQGKIVSNRFFSMPSSRNRIIGAQFYKFDIYGFLHWGYNFYYSQFSKSLVNPYITTDAGGAFPSGDAFSVYPGKDEVIESIRLKVFKDALQDLGAMKLLERYKGKEFVLKIIEEECKEELRFNKYPFFGNYILRYRERINAEIKKFK